MRVLGQAWSIAGAPAGTLPSDVVRTSRKVVTEKALALAEAGLRVSLGQNLTAALRDVAFDFWGAGSGDRPDRGFDQLLRETEAGLELADALGAALAERLATDPRPRRTPFALEASAAQVAASGPDFVTFAVADGAGAAPVKAVLLDGAGRQTALLGRGRRAPGGRGRGRGLPPARPAGRRARSSASWPRPRPDPTRSGSWGTPRAACSSRPPSRGATGRSRGW